MKYKINDDICLDINKEFWDNDTVGKFNNINNHYFKYTKDELVFILLERDKEIKNIKDKLARKENNPITMSEIQQNCYDITVSKGFDLSQTQLSLLLVIEEVAETMETVEEPINGDIKLLTANHIVSALKKDISNIRKSTNYYPENTKILDFEKFSEELSDIVYRVFSIASHFNIDISSEIIKKQEFNKTRELLHGNNR